MRTLPSRDARWLALFYVLFCAASTVSALAATGWRRQWFGFAAVIVGGMAVKFIVQWELRKLLTEQE